MIMLTAMYVNGMFAIGRRLASPSADGHTNGHRDTS